jgi:hypothetical protein
MKQLLGSLCLLACVIGGVAHSSNAQTSAQPSPSPSPSSSAPVQAARPGDVDTVEHIVNAVYDVISGPAGPRDWNRFRSLFYSGARQKFERQNFGNQPYGG